MKSPLPSPPPFRGPPTMCVPAPVPSHPSHPHLGTRRLQRWPPCPLRRVAPYLQHPEAFVLVSIPRVGPLLGPSGIFYALLASPLSQVSTAYRLPPTLYIAIPSVQRASAHGKQCSPLSVWSFVFGL
uniref:Uncharacterized protein n=1 Tax=Molossus molossus TaxID=27622 RepID=A0A7J8JW38_MOLMO|nr:hypothetical protein HJG59_008032 [Molossus molossus]